MDITFNADIYSVYYRAMINKLLVSTILVINALSCVYDAPVNNTQKIITETINSIAVIPFTHVPTEVTPSLSEDFILDFNTQLHKRLSDGLAGVNIISQGKSYEAFDSVKATIGRESAEFIPEFCRKAGCDAVLTGEIKDYRERVGGEYGVESPAAFSFVTKLHDGKTGNIIWEDYYYEKQQPLLENVGEVGKFIKRKGRWVSTREIAYEGIDEMVLKLTNLLMQK